jgi:chromosomal replication initiator protein
LGQRHPDLRVLYLTAEEFTNRFLAAMNERRLAGFRKQVRECDALLLDDLHFLARKQATMEEFLHTFDALHAADRPLAVSCDCHPRLADDLLPELVDRLLGGAVWGLAPPEEETRVALLRWKALHLGGAPLADDVAAYLAHQLRGNVRELEGALHALFHLARVTGRRVDLTLAREAAADVLRHSVRLLHLDDVDQAVCRALGLPAGALQSKERGWAVSHPRMLAMFLARKHTAATYTEIGRRFGRNHSTAVAGEKRVRGWLTENASVNLGQRAVAVREVVERIERELLR